jgi:hypothetical protein
MIKKKVITSVLTGDIIKSRSLKNSNQWIAPLKKTLSDNGSSPKDWEIYRGDSFQVEVTNPEDAVLKAIKIKATIKCIKDLDVRIAIGIGTKDFKGTKITESNGEAFVNSGLKLEGLKKEKQNLAIKSPWNDFDEEMNLLLRLSLIAMDNWTRGAAELIKVLVDHQDIKQSKLAKKLKISQSSVSEKKTRAFYSEIMDLELFYRKKINALLS